MRRRAGLAGLLAVAVAVIGSAAMLGGAVPASAAQPQLTTTGSSFAGVAITQWQGQFNEIYGGNINFTVSSSVIGMNDFCSQTVNFGATDIAYSTQQSNCVTSQVPYPFQYMPDVAGGLSFEYNLTGQNGQPINNLILNAPTIVGIFTGGIQNWDNAEIQALNPDIRLPNEQITAYYRSDPSGENYLLSDYMLHTDPGPITAFQKLATIPTPPGEPSATWASFTNGVPGGLGNLDGVNGADAASQGPVHTPGGISYVEFAYAKNADLPVASVVNQAGDAVQPDSYNVAVALTGAILYSDLTQNLGGVYTNPAPAAYPISAYSYFVAQCVPAAAAAQNFSCDSSGAVTMGAAQGAELSQFITFVACQGQQQMAELGYSPIPANLVLDDFQAAGRLPGGTEPPPPTAANCKNPYVDGQLQPVGNPTQVQTTNPGGSDLSTTGPTGSAVAGSGSTAGASASGGTAATSATAGSTVPTAASRAATVARKRAANPLDTPAAYQRADLLDAAASGALLGWSPFQIALWSSVFVVLLLGLPLAVYIRQRRRRPLDG